MLARRIGFNFVLQSRKRFNELLAGFSGFDDLINVAGFGGNVSIEEIFLILLREARPFGFGVFGFQDGMYPMCDRCVMEVPIRLAAAVRNWSKVVRDVMSRRSRDACW